MISLHDTAEGVVKLIGNSEMGVKGFFALMIHKLLYRMHQASLLGIFKTIRFASASKFMYKTKSTSIFSNRD